METADYSGHLDSFKMEVTEVTYFKTNFIRTVGTLEVEKLVSVKAEFLLPKGNNKNNPFGVTFSFKGP